MKDYLKEELTKEEKSYIYGIIKNTSNKCKKNHYQKSEKEEVLLETTTTITPDYENIAFINSILENKILKNINELKLYSNYEKEIKSYMNYYNKTRGQWNLKKMTPIEYRNHLLGS